MVDKNSVADNAKFVKEKEHCVGCYVGENFLLLIIPFFDEFCYRENEFFSAGQRNYALSL
jgi:hypothetical protein